MTIKIPKPVMVPIKELKLDKNKVKEHSDEQIMGLMELIKMVGFTDPVMIDKKKNVIAGKGSVMAADGLEMKEVPCVYLENLTEEQIKAFMLMDNRINESPWNQEEVNKVLADLKFDFDKFHMTFQDFHNTEPSIREVSFQATGKTCPKCGYEY